MRTHAPARNGESYEYSSQSSRLSCRHLCAHAGSATAAHCVYRGADRVQGASPHRAGADLSHGRGAFALRAMEYALASVARAHVSAHRTAWRGVAVADGAGGCAGGYLPARAYIRIQQCHLVPCCSGAVYAHCAVFPGRLGSLLPGVEVHCGILEPDDRDCLIHLTDYALGLKKFSSPARRAWAAMEAWISSARAR